MILNNSYLLALDRAGQLLTYILLICLPFTQSNSPVCKILQALATPLINIYKFTCALIYYQANFYTTELVDSL